MKQDKEDDLKKFRGTGESKKSVAEWKKEREPGLEADFDKSPKGIALMEKVK